MCGNGHIVNQRTSTLWVQQVGEALEGKEDDTPVRLSAAFNSSGESPYQLSGWTQTTCFFGSSGHPVPKSSVFTGKEVTDASGAKIIVTADEFKRVLTVS